LNGKSLKEGYHIKSIREACHFVENPNDMLPGLFVFGGQNGALIYGKKKKMHPYISGFAFCRKEHTFVVDMFFDTLYYFLYVDLKMV